MRVEEKQQRLIEIHVIVEKAANELQRNGDTYSSVLRLAEALEMVLNYLEQTDVE